MAVVVTTALSQSMTGSAIGREGDSLTPYRVNYSERADIQRLLDEHRSIELEPNKDYRSPGVSYLRVSSGESVVGGWNTRVPTISIEAGTSGAVLSGIRSDGRFGPDVVLRAGQEIRKVRIVGGNGGEGTNIRVKIEAGAHVSELAVSEYGGLEVDQAQGGYVRDSVFTRLMGRWPGPHVLWNGNSAEPSYGNAFIGLESLTPLHASIWRRAGDLWLVGLDAESWGSVAGSDVNAFVVEDSAHVTSLGLSGGTAYPNLSGALGLFRDVRTLTSWFLHGSGGNVENADLELEDVQNSIFIGIDTPRRVYARSTLPESMLTDVSGNVRASLSGTETTKPWTKSLVPVFFGKRGTFDLFSQHRGPDRPERRDIDLPTEGVTPDAVAASHDSSPDLQTQIDSRGIAIIEPGTYYLAQPLHIGSRIRTEGLVSRGPGPVILVAKGEHPVIEGRGNFRYHDRRGDSVIKLVLGGLTIYGGTYGINWSGDSDNLGEAAVVAWSTFYDLRFIGQSKAAVRAEGIGGLDENFWYQVDFLNLPAGIVGRGHGVEGGMNYADKQHFLDCQFQDIVGVVWDWQDDRASNADQWTNSYFYNVGGVTRTRAAVGMVWSNDVFENVRADVALHVTDAGTTATYYFIQISCLWKGEGPRIVTDPLTFRMGVLFVDTTFGQYGGSIVASGPGQSMNAIGSEITGSASLGTVEQGVFVNSRLSGSTSEFELFSSGKAH